MEGIYPLLLDGERAGELTVSVQGAWTLFAVRCAPRPGIVRVSVYGAGREGYLGVLTPEGDALTLRRRLSRSALRGFPETIEYAGAAGRLQNAAPDPAPPPEECVDSTSQPSEDPARCADPAPPPAEKAPPDPEALSWYASPDGALVCFDGTENLLALPLGDARIPAGGGQKRTVEGREYMVFRTRDGRIIT